MSFKHSFLFIHIQKTAGTSLTHYLEAEVEDLESVLRPHDPFLIAEEKIGRGLEGLTKIAFVRNPFERLVSWYTMIKTHGVLLSETEKKQNPDHNRIWQFVLSNSSCFEEFVHHCYDAVDRSGWKPFQYNQIDYLKDSRGHMAMDFVGRFENLETDFRKLCRLINIQYRALPHVNQSEHSAYRQYYSAETRKVIEARFAEDLNFFNYRF